MSVADTLSLRYRDDGQCFTDSHGLDLGDECERLSVETKVSLERDATSYVFSDGSCIVIAGAGWDFKDPDCTCGFCWQGAGPRCLEE